MNDFLTLTLFIANSKGFRSSKTLTIFKLRFKLDSCFTRLEARIRTSSFTHSTSNQLEALTRFTSGSLLFQVRRVVQMSFTNRPMPFSSNCNLKNILRVLLEDVKVDHGWGHHNGLFLEFEENANHLKRAEKGCRKFNWWKLCCFHSKLMVGVGRFRSVEVDFLTTDLRLIF